MMRQYFWTKFATINDDLSMREAAELVGENVKTLQRWSEGFELPSQTNQARMLIYLQQQRVGRDGIKRRAIEEAEKKAAAERDKDGQRERV